MIEIAGSYPVEADREQVWSRIVDPSTLQHLIPGCQSLEQVGPDEYKGHIVLSLPAVSGEFETLVSIEEQDPPSQCRFQGEIAGSAGRIAGTASFTLAEAPDTTDLHYEAKGMVTGALARLPERVLRILANSLLRQGLARLNQELVSSARQETDSDGPKGAMHAHS